MSKSWAGFRPVVVMPCSGKRREFGAEEVGSLCTSPSTTARGLPLPKSEPLKTAPMGLSSSWPRQVTAHRRPQTNGKAEAFIKTSLREWAYAQLYTTNQERLEALPVWLDYYNHQRTHTELKNRAPMTVLVSNVNGQYN